MMKMRMILLISVTFTFLAASVNEPNECEYIIKAINKADINELSPHLADAVECDLFGKSSIYSKSQTIQVMKDFFANNKPKNFTINHQGSQKQRLFLIGTYKTVRKNFRISCFVKKESDKKIIQQIRIENE
jgi:hypothetical protein